MKHLIVIILSVCSSVAVAGGRGTALTNKKIDVPGMFSFGFEKAEQRGLTTVVRDAEGNDNSIFLQKHEGALDDYSMDGKTPLIGFAHKQVYISQRKSLDNGKEEYISFNTPSFLAWPGEIKPIMDQAGAVGFQSRTSTLAGDVEVAALYHVETQGRNSNGGKVFVRVQKSMDTSLKNQNGTVYSIKSNLTDNSINVSFVPARSSGLKVNITKEMGRVLAWNFSGTGSVIKVYTQRGQIVYEYTFAIVETPAGLQAQAHGFKAIEEYIPLKQLGIFESSIQLTEGRVATSKPARAIMVDTAPAMALSN